MFSFLTFFGLGIFTVVLMEEVYGKDKSRWKNALMCVAIFLIWPVILACLLAAQIKEIKGKIDDV